MSNGDDDKKSNIEKASDVATKLGETIETLFGKPSAAPMSGGSPSNVVSGPPQVTNAPGGVGGRFDPRGAAGGSLPSPQRVQQQPPASVGAMQTGTEFATPAGMKGAVAAGGLSSVIGAIHGIANQKKQEKIQHAEFLYNLVKSAYESGDQQTANIILQDDKNRTLIEKYVTGALPRVPGKPSREETLYQPRTPGSTAMKPGGTMDVRQSPSKLGDINKPGGPALPKPNAQSQMAAAVQNMIMEGIKNKDPRIMDKVLGEGTSLSKEDYSKAMRAKFGIELAPAQVQALDAKSQLALAETKADILKYVIGQSAMTDRAVAVAKIHAGGTVDAAKAHEAGRLEVAKSYREFLLKVKGSAPDKMEQTMYQGLSKLYTGMAQNSISQSAKLAKDNPKMAQQLQDEAKQYVMKAENMKAQYEAGKFLDDLLKDGVPGTEDAPDKPGAKDEEEDDNNE